MAKSTNITNWDQVPVIFDVAMASRLLAINYDKVRQMCRNGEIPAYKIGTNSWRINKDKFRNWLEERERLVCVR